jgi:hypothetical protein
LWDFGDGLLRERYAEVLESRGIQSGDKVLQVLARTLELKFGEKSKKDVT